MADLSALRELHAWMREARVVYARTGDLELRLEPLPPTLVPLDDVPVDEQAEQRLHLETLLYSSGGDVDALLARRAG